MDTMNVKPAKSLKVRDPEHGMTHLPDAGRKVPQSPYWLRRLRDGDVVRADAEESATAKSASTAGAPKDKKGFSQIGKARRA